VLAILQSNRTVQIMYSSGADGDSAILPTMLFLKQLHLNPDGSCTDFDVREDKPNGRTVGRVYKDISAGWQWFWCLNDRAPSPAGDLGHAPSKGEAMLRLKRRWLERGPLKAGKMQMGRPKWMDSHPDYGPAAD
jgi:hypothetical protein